MEFQKVSISDKDIFDKYLDRENRRLCEYCFTDIFMWKDLYNTEYCIKNDVLYIRQSVDDRSGYFYFIPMPSDKKLVEGINSIILDSIENDYTFALGGASLEILSRIGKEFRGVFHAQSNRDYSDYIYNAADLINLSGRKFHKKKNLVNKFKSVYKNRWEYRAIALDDVERILSFNENWIQNSIDKDIDAINSEHNAIKEALNNYETLEIVGGMLLVDGEIIAYTLATRVRDMYIVQVEKALPDYVGSYQMINNEFAKENYTGVRYVNREEDVGIEGLRKAKMSYNPAFLEDYYEVSLKKKIDCITIMDYNEGMHCYDKICNK